MLKRSEHSKSLSLLRTRGGEDVCNFHDFVSPWQEILCLPCTILCKVLQAIPFIRQRVGLIAARRLQSGSPPPPPPQEGTRNRAETHIHTLARPRRLCRLVAKLWRQEPLPRTPMMEAPWKAALITDQLRSHRRKQNLIRRQGAGVGQTKH